MWLSYVSHFVFMISSGSLNHRTGPVSLKGFSGPHVVSEDYRHLRTIANLGLRSKPVSWRFYYFSSKKTHGYTDFLDSVAQADKPHHYNDHSPFPWFHALGGHDRPESPSNIYLYKLMQILHWAYIDWTVISLHRDFCNQNRILLLMRIHNYCNFLSDFVNLELVGYEKCQNRMIYESFAVMNIMISIESKWIFSLNSFLFTLKNSILN